MGLFVFLFFLFHSQPLLSSPLPSPSYPSCHPLESSALLQFKNSFSINQNLNVYYSILTNITSYPKTVSWKNGTNCCSWEGVSCDSIPGHVVGLNLGSSCLQGQLHSNSSLFSLRHLQSLNLDYNDFNGSPIPPEFGGFRNLTWLSIVYANFAGYVPVELAYLSNLVQLYLTNNVYYQYELRLEPYLFRRMVHNLTNLRYLSLCGVNMFDVEPATSLVNVSSSLTDLDLRWCQLRGKFPEKIFRLPNLQGLCLDNNLLVFGSLPMYNWSTPLRYLSLSNTEISIDISYLSTSAKSLQSLYLSGCKFKGSYPALMANLTQLLQLTTLDLSSNSFGGQIPWSYLNNIRQLTCLVLSRNNFISQLPEISSINSSQILVPMNLIYLDLSSNLLSGSIPSWIFSLPHLQYLTLESNQFTGCIEEFQTRSLRQLSLSMNKLHGQLPISIFQQEDLYFLSLSYNNMSGVLELNMFSKLKNLKRLDLCFNSFFLSKNSYVDNPFPQLRELRLSSCNISEFPYFLRSFERLDLLHLSHNQIHGEIPKWLWNEGTQSLSYLNLSHNFLTSVEQIPWKSLSYLDLRSNHLQGKLPIVPPSIVVFFISNNQLAGEIPSLYCQLSALAILDLSNNSFHGNIPSCLGNLYPLSVLDLSLNKFTGIIPDMFSNSTRLRSLHLSGNLLEGPLPQSLHNCRNLEVLDVGKNKITDTFPNWLESLPTLQVLVLRSNRLHGSIGNSKKKSPFQKLRIMDLSHNEFIGLLPAEYLESFNAMMEEHVDRNLTHIGDMYYQDSVLVSMKDSDVVLGKILSIFTTIDLSRNNFEGEIPESVGILKSLKGLNFSGNKLTGCIPVSMRNLTNLEWLDLSSNELVGEIPEQMTDLTQLAFLNLSHNKLVGPIPHGKQFDTFNSDSYKENLGLCGFPLSKSCEGGEAQQKSDHEEHADEIFAWKIVMMGYGCGLVIGISVGYMVLFSRRFDYWLRKRVGREQGRHGGSNVRLRGR